MPNDKDILLMIKNSVKTIAPDATVILYGSYARGDNRDDSDIDLLILLEKDKITWQDEKKIKSNNRIPIQRWHSPTLFYPLS